MSRFIVFGKVGSGKSTLCNMLLSGHPSPSDGFRASDGIRGATTAVSEKRSREWIAVDTIGMGEAEVGGTVSTDDAKTRLKEFLKKTNKEYKYIIFVAEKGRFADETSIYWNAFQEIFKGGESNFVVVYTHANQNWIEKNREALNNAYAGHTRFIGVDFWPLVENEDELPDENTRKTIRERSLKKLKDSLEGYSFNSIKPDICYLEEAELEVRAGAIITSVKKSIQNVFPKLTQGSITSIVWNIFFPLLGLKEEELDRSTPMYEQLQLRSDVPSARFLSWNQGFHTHQIPILCDMTSTKEEAYFIFLHAEDMASLFGIGIPHSKISIILDRQEVVVEEMTESSWKTFWMGSYEGPFRPLLLEKSKFEMEEVSHNVEKNVLHMTKEEALSTMGISMEGPQVQEFVKMGGSTSQDVEGRKQSIPTFLSPGAMSQEQGSHKPVQESGNQISGSTKAGVIDKTDQSKKRLVVVVKFLSFHNCVFSKVRESDTEQRDMVEGNSDLLSGAKDISCIYPRLKVEFLHKREREPNCDENSVITTLMGEYQMGPNQMGCQDPLGWHQDDLRLSFQGIHDQDGNWQCYLGDRQIISEQYLEDIELTEQAGESKSTQPGTNVQAGAQVGPFYMQANRPGQTGQTSGSDQRKFKRKARLLANNPSFDITDQSNCGKRMMEFKATNLDKENVAAQSSVKMEVHGTWDIYKEEVHTYEFKTTKRLSYHTTKTKKRLSYQPRSPESRMVDTFFWVASPGRGEIPEDEVFLQSFSRRFLLNHNCRQFFEAHKRFREYTWSLSDARIEQNPVPNILNVAI